jgi:hypothetical protein
MGLSSRRALALTGSAACVIAAMTPLAAHAVPTARPGPAAQAGRAAQPWAAARTTPAKPRWSVFKILNEKRYDTLLTLAAVGKHDAWAFGQTSSGRGIAVHWTGSAWTGSRITGAFDRPGFSSATGPHNIWASGSECTSGPQGTSVTATYIARYNGRTWTTRKWTTAAFCWAALVTTARNNGWLLGDNRALHFTGRRWHKVSLPSLGQVVAATAVSASDIWAIGARFNARQLSRSKAFFTHFDGRAWRIVPLPHIKLPPHGYIYPDDVAAAGARNIWAAVTIYPAAVHSVLLHFGGRKWRAIPLPAKPDQLLKVAPDGAGGVWAIMFSSAAGTYEFAHYARGTWTYQPVPTAGLPGLVPGSESFDLFALARVPGTTSVLASGDVFYSNAKNASITDSLIFRYGT